MSDLVYEDEELDRLQISIDRARSAAQRTFHRSLKELRRLPSERLYATFVAADHTKQTAQPASADSAKQSQSEPAQRALFPAAPPGPASPVRTTNKAVPARP